jgi:SAM-dependent methyltransferase
MSPHDLPSSPAAERNKAPILAVLEQLLPATATVIEIAAGTGQHAEHFAAAHPAWTWWPTDADAVSVPIIAARCAPLPNVQPTQRLDVLQPWPALPAQADAVYCANMLHISAWPTCAALMQGAADHLKPGGWLVLYGPYLVDGKPTAPSNLAFDADLKARNPAWGLRRLSDVIATANAAGLDFERLFDMPANNFTLAFTRR